MPWTSIILFSLLLGLLLHAETSTAQEWVRFQRVQLQQHQPPDPPLASKRLRSSAECGKLCTSHFRCTCRSYGYHRTSRDCHLFSGVLQPGGNGGSPGYVYYVGEHALGGAGSPCDGDQDCGCLAGALCVSGRCECPPGHHEAASRQCVLSSTLDLPCLSNQTCAGTPNVFCLHGVCQCVHGFHRNPGPRSCVATCPHGYGDTYYMVRQHECMNGHNAATDWTPMSLEDCWRWCQADPQCRSFEHAANRCYKSYTTVLEHPEAWKSCYDGGNSMTYYQRNCA